jgi:hypothetical protein
LADHLLNSAVGTNLFLALPEKDRLAFVQKVYEAFGKSGEVKQALSSQYYAPYFLLVLIDRDNYMKMTENDFKVYETCLSNVTDFELDELSKSQENEERFMKFVKYIEILGAEDKKKVQGLVLKQRIFSLPKFQSVMGTSLHVFDVESQVFEEGEVEERAHNVHTAQAVHAH